MLEELPELADQARAFLQNRLRVGLQVPDVRLGGLSNLVRLSLRRLLGLPGFLLRVVMELLRLLGCADAVLLSVLRPGL